jgi:hypothetical protein
MALESNAGLSPKAPSAPAGPAGFASSATRYVAGAKDRSPTSPRPLTARTTDHRRGLAHSECLISFRRSRRPCGAATNSRRVKCGTPTRHRLADRAQQDGHRVDPPSDRRTCTGMAGGTGGRTAPAGRKSVRASRATVTSDRRSLSLHVDWGHVMSDPAPAAGVYPQRVAATPGPLLVVPTAILTLRRVPPASHVATLSDSGCRVRSSPPPPRSDNALGCVDVLKPLLDYPSTSRRCAATSSDDVFAFEHEPVASGHLIVASAS